MNHLHHLAVDHPEGRAQGLVSGAERVQGPFHGDEVKFPLQPNSERNMIDGVARFETVKKPQSRLSK